MSVPHSIPARLIFWGGTGQSKVMYEIVKEMETEVVAVFDRDPEIELPFTDIPLYEGKDGFETWIADREPAEFGFVAAVGHGSGHDRLSLQEYLTSYGLKPTSLVDSSAYVATSASVGSGAQVHPGAVIMAETDIGDQCIINTNANVDHECVLSDGVDIGPGATLCGLITVEQGAAIGAGATVLPEVTVGADATIAAGATVVDDVAPGETVAGCSAETLD